LTYSQNGTNVEALSLFSEKALNPGGIRSHDTSVDSGRPRRLGYGYYQATEHVARMIGLGEFSPIGRLFTLGSCFKQQKYTNLGFLFFSQTQ
jgi:hypothetical protein